LWGKLVFYLILNGQHYAEKSRGLHRFGAAKDRQNSRQGCRLPSGAVDLKTTADKKAASSAGVEKTRSMSRQEAGQQIHTLLSIYL